MSREDRSLPDEALDTAPEVVERGVDHNGKPQWYMSTREGWVEVGDSDGALSMRPEHFPLDSRLVPMSPLDE